MDNETSNNLITGDTPSLEPAPPKPHEGSRLTGKMPTNKWNRVFVIVSLLTIMIVLTGLVFLVIVFSDGKVTKPAPDPKSANLIKKRDSVKKDILTEFGQLEKSFIPAQTADSTYDSCYTGQNNSKVREGYAHRCDYRVTRYYGFNSDFRETMLDLEKVLFNLEWQASNGSHDQLSYYIENYYDKYYGNKDPQVSANFGGNYYVSSLPTVNSGYSKDGIWIDIVYSEKDSKDTYILETAQGFSKRGFPFFEVKDFVDVSSTFAEITISYKYVIAISLEKNYFQN